MSFKQLIRSLRKQREKSIPPDIRIAGIYVICSKLRLGKTYRPEYLGRQMLVPMNSGRDAIYSYVDFAIASNCDWDWHIYRFTRYVKPGEAPDLVRYG